MPRPRKLPHELSNHPARANLEKGRPAPGSEAARLRNAASVTTRRVNTLRHALAVAQIELDEEPTGAVQARREHLVTITLLREDLADAFRARDAAHAAMRAYSTAHTPQKGIDNADPLADWN